MVPLVFVHGVATRNSPERTASIKQRDALFRQLVFSDPIYPIFNPDWGSLAPRVIDDPAWIPKSTSLEAFGNEHGDDHFGLSEVSAKDGEAAVDAIVGSALHGAVHDAVAHDDPARATDPGVLALARSASLSLKALYTSSSAKVGVIAPIVGHDDTAVAFSVATHLKTQDDGSGDMSLFSTGLGRIADWLFAKGSDKLLAAGRRQGTVWTARFLGDVIAYLSGYRTGTEIINPLLVPIIDDLVDAWNGRVANEAMIAIGHSFGGVLLYEALSDPQCLSMIRDRAPGFRVDRFVTVGSQLAMFADLGLFDHLKLSGGLGSPTAAGDWWNVVDFTDPLGFLCAPTFSDVTDFSYDTGLDLVQSHTAYFSKPSFYSRLSLRLAGR